MFFINTRDTGGPYDDFLVASRYHHAESSARFQKLKDCILIADGERLGLKPLQEVQTYLHILLQRMNLIQ